MAAPAKSRWGSLLSQAVAGVEARLDDILADKEEGPNEQKPQKPQVASTPPVPASPSKLSPSTGPSRTASNSRPNDRLQERLARAIAVRSTTPTGTKPDTSQAKGSGSNQNSPRQSADIASRVSTESAPSTRGLQEAPVIRTSQDEAATPADTAGEDALGGDSLAREAAEGGNDVALHTNGVRASLDGGIASDSATTTQTDEPPAPEGPLPEAESLATELAVSGKDEKARQRDKALEESVLQHQEEIHNYVEQIDALQAKLQYLARETTDAARKAAQAAPAGSAEKKLAEKDQQIGQLMEEGKVLTSTEQKHRTIIKKLRVRTGELEKELGELQSAKARTEAELESQRRRGKRVDELEGARDDLHKRLNQVQKELSAARSENASKDSQISELKSQLRRETQQAEALSAKVNDEARDQDRRRIAELEESLAAAQLEKGLAADRARQQTHEWREKAERATERARALELEMKAELQVVEGKLEATRARAEEASSGAGGDSQAKLLRQVETLQTQYSVANDNWQGIEATLRARLTNLERERDEAQQRESDMRKKAREAAVRAKRNEEELEEAKTRLPTIQEDVKSYQSQLESLRKRAEDAEALARDMKTEHEKQKQNWKDEINNRPEPQERRGWLEDLPNTPLKTNSRPDSPNLTAPQRTFSSDLLGLQSLSSKVRKASAPSSNSDLGTTERVMHRRPSAQPVHTSVVSPGAFGGSAASASSMFSPTYDSLPTPASQSTDRDDMFEGVETSSSPQQVMQDMVSVSTVAAGPSVQLVERMSAAIRRLESEKVAAREELARIQSQRDEARAEIVALMREAESSRAAATRVAGLEAEVADINARYQTTLEMLGEKSELVDELRADVEDVKAMYRDLVERTIK